MEINVPIGTVCAFAGQVNPVSSSPNNVWSATDCASQDRQEGSVNPEVPLLFLEAEGWMLCDGRYLGVEAYPELFAVLGYLYGQGDGSFKIPDFRGLFLRGVDAGAGMDPQAAQRVGPKGSGKSSGIGSLQCDAFQDHTHNYSAVNLATPASTGNAGAKTAFETATASPNSPALFGPETRPKNVAVNYIIKFR